MSTSAPPAGRLVVARIGPAVALTQGRDERVAAILLRQIHQHAAVEIARVTRSEPLQAALLRMQQEIAIQHAAPTRAALEKGNVEPGKTAGPASEKHRLA